MTRTLLNLAQAAIVAVVLNLPWIIYFWRM